MQLLRTTLAAACLMAVSLSAMASDADFRLKNKTGYQIDEVYVSRHSSDSWGKDIMGSDALDDGESVKITFPHGGSACKFDIKVRYHDNDTAEWDNVDLCEWDAITLLWDPKTQTTKAVGE